MASILCLFNEQQKQAVFSKNKTIELQSGDMLFEHATPADNMYRVEKGKISLYRLMANGDEKLFSVFLPGDMIAEMAIFMQPRIYPMHAKADQYSVISALYYKDVLQCVSHCSQLSLQVMHFMSNRIHHLMETQNILTQVNANQRLVMKLADIYKCQLKKEGKVFLSVTKKLLATQLAMTPETLSRVIKRLKDKQLIVESAGCISIPDISKLCAAADLTEDIFY
ncbi:Crp/Fnr family transcriptional regulator [Psychromonas sp. CNPT3]|uniref:Crp/Fnr family transcriptional regulator n=1 Tax=Psychromonas sp. CNPT3 TaxID=314282 RepID=UPI00006E4816|nr:Crp/Fnr family transcriptional regulator [Psychromonas sp. CNPT3]AGH81219.1 Crp/Fnr family transcriptional regulator [Psychromonas sp. CNPT3]